MIGALINAGIGLFGQHQARKDAKARREYAEQQRELAYERSLPWSSFGPAGNVEFDPETKEMLQTLNPEYQAMMQGFLGSSSMANQELQNMMGDPNKLAQEQFKMFEEFNADAFNQQRLQGQEAAIAQGRTGTQGYYDQMAIEDAIGRDRMRGQMAAIGTGMDYRNMLRAEALGFGADARATAGMLRPQAELGQAIGAGVDVRANMQGITDANKDYYKLKQNQTSGLMEQIGEYDLGDLGSKIKTGWSMFSDAMNTNAIRNGTGFSSAQDNARSYLFPK
jgi:hypothetical protein